MNQEYYASDNKTTKTGTTIIPAIGDILFFIILSIFQLLLRTNLGFYFDDEKVSEKELIDFIRQKVINNPTPSLPDSYYDPGYAIDWQRFSNSLNAKQFKDLEMILNTAENGLTISIDGIPNIWNKMDLGFEEADMEIITEYCKQFPKSPWPYILRAEYYVWYAWKARGTGYGNTVTTDGGRKMRIRLKKAYNDYLTAIKNRPNVIYSYSGAGYVAMHLGKKRTALKFYEKSLSFDPAYWTTMNNIFDNCKSKWYGPDDKYMFEFARAISKKHPEYPYLERLVIKAHEEIILRYANGSKTFAKDYLSQTEVWNEIMLSYEKIFTKYPTSKYARKYFRRICRRAGKDSKAIIAMD